MLKQRSSSRPRWEDRADYRWVIGFLRSHSVLGWTKLLIGLGGAMMLVNATLMAISPAGVRGPVGMTVNTLAATIGGLWALRWWLLPWPSECESLTWIALVDLVVTADSLLVADRVLGAMGILMLVAAGTYLAVFHRPRVLALHVCWTLLSAVALAVLTVHGSGRWHGDLALGVALVIANAALIGLAIPTMHLSHLLLRLDSLSDPLTRLLNRRGLDSQLSQCGGYGRDPLYAITLDLDRFKTVNDTYGHPFGDEVLKRTANRLRAAADADALIARTGGEEFVVVGRGRDQSAAAVAERLRAAIETMPDLPITITASVGVALFTRSGPRDRRARFDALLASDAAMYEAKRLGGNIVVTAESARPVAR
ncbi:GGDEF domain-containing protein [Nocardia sp. CDC159]|uniref:GGDEF domain-containing protein n=1 Tax=Nocardia pulmonis TaxID=2951408 RepID=A0A9X2IWY4_9NOCA|nr:MULTISPECIES: GGDEF domain-containing protein [Nocardia]MCM6774054.1 GGDEF domain-containing protein [Nocardia pulmonis]MCM6786941.1 GGDEF domain-containing protein [Nocardia sp. CDC159]